VKRKYANGICSKTAWRDPPNTVWKGGRRVRNGNVKEGMKLVQGTLYACIELPQWDPYVLLMYTDS
jgi:hypothetical protein